MKRLFLTAAMTAAVIAVNAQNTTQSTNTPADCRCEESFEWLRSTFEENDAGFGYIVERKGRAAYALHNQMTLEKVRTTQTNSECAELMNEWLMFFRRGHIGIELLRPDVPAQQTATHEPEIWAGDIAAFEKDMAVKENPGYEGIWAIRSGEIKIGIAADGDGYVGFITESDDGSTKPGTVIMRITRDGDKWETKYYNGAQTSVESSLPEQLGNRYLHFRNRIVWRVLPELPTDPAIERRFAGTPHFEQLNPTTLYISIPSFDYRYKPAIDKIIADNFAALTSTENLIIDVRGNGGGFSTSYEKRLALIYTNPIKTPAGSYYSTPLNIENTEELLDIEGIDEETRIAISTLVEKMKARPGEFVPESDEDMNIDIRDKVYEYPRNVGIIINGDCASATEMFLLAARQSLKVKLFGNTTMGAHDVSDVRSVDSPDGMYRLHYATSISMGVPGIIIDEIGVHPDFYLNPSIPDEK